MDEGNELEILLVLCCLVGVTVFLCFSLSAVNLSAQIDAKTAIGAAPEDPADLQRRLEALPQEIAALAAQVEKLTREIEQRRLEAAKPPAPVPSGDRSTELAALQRQLEEVRNTIDRLTAELDRLKQAGIRQSEREVDLERLRQTLEQLKKQIEEKRKILSAIPLSADPALETDLRKLREALAGLDRQSQEARKFLAGMAEEPGTFNIRRNLSGNTTLKNPAVVECRKTGIVFHPEGREITVPQLKSGNPFQQLRGNPDGIVFLIRPDGFEAFHAVFDLAEKTSLPIIFEAVDAGMKLKF